MADGKSIPADEQPVKKAVDPDNLEVDPRLIAPPPENQGRGGRAFGRRGPASPDPDSLGIDEVSQERDNFTYEALPESLRVALEEKGSAKGIPQEDIKADLRLIWEYRNIETPKTVERQVEFQAAAKRLKDLDPELATQIEQEMDITLPEDELAEADPDEAAAARELKQEFTNAKDRLAAAEIAYKAKPDDEKARLEYQQAFDAAKRLGDSVRADALQGVTWQGKLIRVGSAALTTIAILFYIYIGLQFAAASAAGAFGAKNAK